MWCGGVVVCGVSLGSSGHHASSQSSCLVIQPSSPAESSLLPFWTGILPVSACFRSLHRPLFHFLHFSETGHSPAFGVHYFTVFHCFHCFSFFLFLLFLLLLLYNGIIHNGRHTFEMVIMEYMARGGMEGGETVAGRSPSQTREGNASLPH